MCLKNVCTACFCLAGTDKSQGDSSMKGNTLAFIVPLTLDWYEDGNCVQDMKDNMFAETEPAQALKEIRARDPNFDMVKFLYHLKIDVPVVIQAYLRGEVDTLKQHCSKDMVERLSGIIAAQQAQVCLCTLDTVLSNSPVFVCYNMLLFI